MTRFYNTDNDFLTSFGPFEGESLEEVIRSEEVHNLILRRVLEIAEEDCDEDLSKKDRKLFLKETKESVIESLNDSFVELDEKTEALVQFLDVSPDEILEIEVSSFDDCSFDTPSGEYMVLTEDEAEEKWDEYLDSYIEDCVLSEIPVQYRNYFDEEKFKNDAKHDGRGHCLSSYDGDENEEKIDGEWYFIYRTN